MDSGVQQLNTLCHRTRRRLWPPRAPCYQASPRVSVLATRTVFGSEPAT